MSAPSDDEEEESGDWLICMREGAGSSGFGWEKAPVDCFCSFSKSSWSSFGRRGGEGPPNMEEVEVEVLNAAARRESWRGRWVMVRSIVVVIVGLFVEMDLDDVLYNCAQVHS